MFGLRLGIQMARFVGRLMGFCLAALKMEPRNGSPVNGSDSNGSKKKSGGETTGNPGVASKLHLPVEVR